MKKSKIFFINLSLIIVSLLVLNSCVTFKVKNTKNPENVNKKIYDEFKNSVDKKDFYSACKSYIEYRNCCSKEDKSNSMVVLLKNLYKEKVEQALKSSTNNRDAINYSFTMYNLLKGEYGIKKGEWTGYEKDIAKFIKGYLEKEIIGKSDLERASVIMHLGKYLQNYYYPYEKLVELFIRRGNPVLAEKYIEILKTILAKNEEINPSPEGYNKKLKGLLKKIEQLRGKDKNKALQHAIDSTIDSSVKIIVDKGIKTEAGRGIPNKILGTGVVIDNKGYILTNYHIIKSSVNPKYEGYSKIYVIPGKDEESEDTKFVAEVVGYDKIFDLAMLKVVKGLSSKIMIGNSDGLREGEQVIAIGNPVGLINTVTSGVVSATKRPFIQIGSIIQIDTALNPGNSGGALIDKNGYLVGITFAGFLNYQNLNFAIPSNLVLNDIFKLFHKGEVKRSWIGSSIEKNDGMLVVDYIVPESNAEIAGLKVGDIIKAVNGKVVKEIYDIQNEISFFEKPIVVSVNIDRDEKKLMLKIALEHRPTYPAKFIHGIDTKENIVTPLFGIVLTNMEISRRKFYPVERVITGSPSDEFGITEGDEIRLRAINYDKKNGVFALSAELKSKRFGFLNKNIVLYTYEDINSFI